MGDYTPHLLSCRLSGCFVSFLLFCHHQRHQSQHPNTLDYYVLFCDQQATKQNKPTNKTTQGCGSNLDPIPRCLISSQSYLVAWLPCGFAVDTSARDNSSAKASKQAKVVCPVEDRTFAPTDQPFLPTPFSQASYRHQPHTSIFIYCNLSLVLVASSASPVVIMINPAF
jgi:hypothetical protein